MTSCIYKLCLFQKGLGFQKLHFCVHDDKKLFCYLYLEKSGKVLYKSEFANHLQKNLQYNEYAFLEFSLMIQ